MIFIIDKDSVDEDTVNDIKKSIGLAKDEKRIIREVAIIKGDGQLTIRIPKLISDLAKVNPSTDKFEFKLVYEIKEGKTYYGIHAQLIRKIK